MFIDWIFANLNLNNAFLQPLPAAPASWPSNYLSRSGIVDGLNRAQVASLQPMFPAGYAGAAALPGLLNTWEYFLLTYPANQRNVISTMLSQHNRIAHKVFDNTITLRDLLKKETFGTTTN